MSNEHPITPPPELRQLWAQQAQRMDPHDPVAWQEHIATQASRWGADQELEACCEWVHGYAECGDSLRAARRPKPPNLVNQSLIELANLEDDLTRHGLRWRSDAIRAALERLKELEQANTQPS